MSELDKDQVITKFTQAYTAANGKAPEIEAKGGWYSVNGDKNVRLAQLDEMADELAGDNTSGKSKTATKTVTSAKPNPKTASNKTTKTKSKAKKASKKSPKQGNDTFSVKAMWADQIEQRNPGSTQPR